jgi:hypothetical protein
LYALYYARDGNQGRNCPKLAARAFKPICQSLSAPIRDNEQLQPTFASAVLRLFDQGERDPMRLGDGAFRQLSGTDRSTVA